MSTTIDDRPLADLLRERVEEIKTGAREKTPRAADPERVVAVARQNPLPPAVAMARLAGVLTGRALANR